MPNKKLIYGIDPYAPGGIEELLAHHRLTFDDAVMQEGAGGAGGAGGDAGDSGADAGTGDAGAEAADADKPDAKGTDSAAAKTTEWDGKVDSLPAGAQKIINDLRGKDGDERIAAKTLAAIQKALNPDAKGNEKPNAEQLTAQLTAQAETTKQVQTELAVYKLAGKQGADADALLDSRAFLAKIADLDHTDTKAVTKAITDAITDNPKLKAARAAGQSGADFSGGSGEQRTKKSASLTEATANHYGTK